MSVSVVVPYFEQPARLDLVLAGLELQTLRGFDVVVADDGSREAPRPGRRSYPVQVVRQADRGIRPAAARNLGVAACEGDLLCFLDGDTVPGPDYLEQTLAALDGRRAVGTGRRRHVDLTGWTPPRLTAWLAGAPGHDAPPELDDPAWLQEAYSRTYDLAHVGDDGYRFVVGAVQSLPRALLAEVGGWEGDIDVYGGEDWELAHRCWLAGADLVHVPGAVAWHDGPDLAGRHIDRRAVKNAETAVLARYVTDPATRGRGLVYEQPDVVVELDDTGASTADVAVCVASLLRDTDAGVWLVDGAALGHAGPLTQDPRVHRGPVPAAVAARCRYRAVVPRPVRLVGASLRELCDRAPLSVGRELVLRRTRDLSLGRAAAPSAAGIVLEKLDGVALEQTWGRLALGR